MAMVHLDDLDVPILAQPRGGLLHQMRKQGDAKRGVAGLEDWHCARGVVDCPVVALLEPGGPDDQRDASANRGMQIGFQTARRREIDQHIARIGKPRDIAALVHPAGQFVPEFGQDGGDRLPHPALAADDPDPCHCHSPHPHASWATWPACAISSS